MSEDTKTAADSRAVVGPVERQVRPGLPVIGCVWGGMVWLVSLRSPKKMDLGARLYSEAELDAAVAAERERCCRVVVVQCDDARLDVARRTILAIRAGDDYHGNVDRDGLLRA